MKTRTQSSAQRGITLSSRESEDWSEVRLQWQQLEERLEEGALATRAIWVDCWIKHYGDLIPHRFLIARSKDRIVGIAMITEGVQQTDGPLILETRHLGTAGEPERDSVFVEFNDVLCEPKHRAEFLSSIVETMEEENTWIEFRMDGVAADAGFLDAFGKKARLTINSIPSHYMDLKALREQETDILSTFGRSTRYRTRQNLKHYDQCRVEWAETVEDAIAIYEDMVRLHQDRWTAVGEPGCYASDRFRNFHHDLIVHLMPEGKVIMSRVSNGDEVIGATQHWVYRNELQVYQCGNINSSGKLSPGLLVDYMNLQQAFDRGYDAYDFLAGDTIHKKKLSTNHRKLLWIVSERQSFRRQALRAARALRTRVTKLMRDEEQMEDRS